MFRFSTKHALAACIVAGVFASGVAHSEVYWGAFIETYGAANEFRKSTVLGGYNEKAIRRSR